MALRRPARRGGLKTAAVTLAIVLVLGCIALLYSASDSAHTDAPRKVGVCWGLRLQSAVLKTDALLLDGSDEMLPAPPCGHQLHVPPPLPAGPLC